MKNSGIHPESKLEELKQIARQFDLPPGRLTIETLAGGNINQSFVATVSGPGIEKRFVLQAINKFVFKDPIGVMANLEKIYHQFDQQSAPAIKLPQLILTRDHKTYISDSNQDIWRLFEFIEESQSLTPDNYLKQSQLAGKAYGRFLAILGSLKPETIKETIVDFHNTPKRYQEFKLVCSQDPVGRAKQLQSEIDFLLSKDDLLEPLIDLIGKKQIPIRVTHNDPKMDNVLIHPQTQVCTMIDLDTVMPGYIMYDFGDMVRTFCTTAENEDDLGHVALRLDVFEAMSSGFLWSLKEFLTEKERDTLVFGCIAIVYEQSIRFLGDYLAGDVYYKISYPEHNLHRYLNQRQLLESILEQETEMQAVIQKLNLRMEG